MRCVVSRLIEPLELSYIYNRGALYRVVITIFMHACIILLILLHLDIYRSFFLSRITGIVEPSHIVTGLIVSILTILSSLYLIALRIRSKSLGSDAKILFLHLILQAILWSWILYYVFGNVFFLVTALLSTEVFHAYFWTSAGFHLFSYIIRLFFACKVLRQPDIIRL